MSNRPRQSLGFTLVELSIVLVIIGLIIGGVLVGRDLISAATIRAQISQIEKYQTAVNTFRGKYGYLPGDMPDPYATNYGFAQRGSNSGQGDGNGLLEAGGPYATSSPCEAGGGQCEWHQCSGETGLFWMDLSAANLISQAFSSASATTHCQPYNMTDQSLISLYMPHAKLGANSYVILWSGGVDFTTWSTASDGHNYFGIFTINAINSPFWEGISAAPQLTVAEAYAMDSKTDDGLPLLGRVQAIFVDAYRVHGIGGIPPYYQGVNPGQAAAASSTTCYDNGNNASSQMQYSMNQSNGTNINCALSFQFQ